VTLLVAADDLRARAAVARGALAPLAGGLRGELQLLLQRHPDVPAEKALLSRAGGRCARDGTLLAYDPFDARHRCSRCGAEHTGMEHDRFRLYWHQLWLAERTVHGALLGALLDDAPCRKLAVDLLERYAAQYLRYPNRDNVLGPSRPFFSTYLESIWLLQLCIALNLLEMHGSPGALSSLGARVRDRLIAPSAALIASYDEGTSNRQVWNDAALMAAGVALGDAALVDRAIFGRSGLVALLREGLLADGSWYEGENYHLFAHRGLWYGVQMAERQGASIPTDLGERFAAGFVAPFRTLLPDLTYPSRRDSQYAVSVRQPRFAESCELGIARTPDAQLLGMLARLYDPTVPRGDTGRASSSADVERNLPATGLGRADLSWRALLLAREELPPLVVHPLKSDLLPEQGIAILRRDHGRTYVALDYGHSGGGHGHPDRLDLLLMDGTVRWFDDPGTGSYVDASLHWYRSTLAHTAPLVDGRSQPRVHGALVAVHDDGRAGWVSAEVELLPGLTVRRSVVVADDYLVDRLEWAGGEPHELTLPLHGVDLVDEGDRPLPRLPERIAGGEAVDDGFGYLVDGQRVAAPAGPTALLRGTHDEAVAGGLRGWLWCSAEARWESALAPDVPARPGLAPILLLRATALRGSFVGVWSWRGSVANVAVAGDRVVVALSDGGRDEHAPTGAGWSIERTRTGARAGARAGARERIELGGMVSVAENDAERAPAAEVERARLSLPASVALGEAHYRRSEESWREAGAPRALVRLSCNADRALVIDVDVAPSYRLFVPIEAENPLDNEPAAISGDGVQLYVMAGARRGGWLLVPEGGSERVSVRTVDGWAGSLALTATWRATPAGWALSATVPLGDCGPEVAVDLLVNETGPGRERRRGQLVLSGAAGEFVYLLGDRHDPERLLRFTLPDA
jgi:hypothetical protein